MKILCDKPVQTADRVKPVQPAFIIEPVFANSDMPNLFVHFDVQSRGTVWIAEICKFLIIAGVTSRQRANRTDGVINNRVSRIFWWRRPLTKVHHGQVNHHSSHLLG